MMAQIPQDPSINGEYRKAMQKSHPLELQWEDAKYAIQDTARLSDAKDMYTFDYPQGYTDPENTDFVARRGEYVGEWLVQKRVDGELGDVILRFGIGSPSPAIRNAAWHMAKRYVEYNTNR